MYKAEFDYRCQGNLITIQSQVFFQLLSDANLRH